MDFGAEDRTHTDIKMAGDGEPELPLFAALSELPGSGARQQVRRRLHAMCALYSHTRTPALRVALLDRLETMALEVAEMLAVEMLKSGWRPDAQNLGEAAGERCGATADLFQSPPPPRRWRLSRVFSGAG
jgi:hypothetical protein